MLILFRCLIEFTSKSGPGLYFVGRFFITDSITLLVIRLFRFSFFHNSNLGRLYVSRSLSIFF